jgi:hypothetical protein
VEWLGNDNCSFQQARYLCNGSRHQSGPNGCCSGRLTPRAVADSLSPLAAEILQVAQQRSQDPRENDLLPMWVTPRSAARIRSIQGAIHTVLSDVPDAPPLFSKPELIDNMPLLACFYYSALFATTRDMLRAFRPTNPTWLKKPKTPRHRIAPTWDKISQRFISRVNYLAERLSITQDHTKQTHVSIRTACATRLAFEPGAFGACITSPPYATRIDYVKSVLPELAILGASNNDVMDLRRVSTGSPVVRGATSNFRILRSSSGRSLLRNIKSHPSKGSKRYYFPWMLNYLTSLQAGLLEISRVVIKGGPICIVVQDSHYKQLHVDLQSIVIDTMESDDRILVERKDYETKRHFARLNPRARLHLSSRLNYESLLLFR